MKREISYRFDEFKKLRVGDRVSFIVDDTEIATTVTSEPYYNSDCDEPEWEVETEAGTLSIDNIIYVLEDDTMTGKIIHNEQECEGKFDFSKTEKYMTRGFQESFGNEAPQILMSAIDKVHERYGNKADYLQTFEYKTNEKSVRFWLIVDDYGEGRHVLTALLPEEY